MGKNKKTVVSIRTIIYTTLILIFVALIANLFMVNPNMELAASDNSGENIEVTEEQQIASIGSEQAQTSTAEVTSRGEKNVRAGNNTEITEVQPQTTAEEIQVQTEPEEKYVTLEKVTISKNMDLTVRTGLSKEDFKTLIASAKEDTSKFFYENSDTIYNLCKQYELNEIFFCGLISAESGWNIATNHRNTHNYISLMSKGKLLKYSTVEEGLEVAAKTLHNKYLTKGGCFYYGKTLSAMKTKFCPASSTWVDLVYGRMRQLRY